MPATDLSRSAFLGAVPLLGIAAATGVASAQNQPTAMLKTFRRIFDNQDVFFGNNMLVQTTGTIRVGEVLALEWASSLPALPPLPAAAP